LPGYKKKGMRKKYLSLSGIVSLLAIVVISSCKNSSTGSPLKFNLEKGKQYGYEIAWNMDQKIMDRDDKINLRGNFSFEVIADDGKIKTLKGVYRSFRLYMKIMELEMDIDTDKPVAAAGENENIEGMMHRLFSKIKGNAFKMKVDEEGNILSISGFDEIINSMIDSAGLNKEMELQMRASLKDQFNEQEMKNQFAHIFMIFPGKAVNTGDSWQRNYKIAGKIAADFSTTYTVKQKEGDHVTLDAKSVIGPAGGDMKVKGTQSGTLLVDGKTGLVLRAEFIQEMEAKVNDLQLTINSTGKVTGKEE
jgi:hypothetical protein